MSNIFEAEFGGAIGLAEAAGVRTLASAAKNLTNTSGTPPAKASSAPTGTNKFTYTGLCAAMNQYEQQLVKDNIVQYANKYTVQLVGELKSAKLAIPGTVDKAMTSNQMSDTAKSKLDSDSNSVDTQGLIRNAVAGTQMIQFIEQIVRNSTYITGQQTGVVDSQTGNAKPNSSTSANKTTKWFKISVYATPISPKIDPIRNDYAYSITYIVSPYAINQAESQYFPQATYRGAHKIYDYWFTGNNTQVLFYEQNYKALYFDVMDGKLPVNETGAAASFKGVSTPWQNTRVPTTASQESDQGATLGANNPSSTLADYLYSIGDQGSVTLKIVGDPAWIQQGEVLGLDAVSFNFNGFYPDGAINTDAQQPVFVLNWNAPADYDVNTGLMNVNASATQGNNNNLQRAQPAQTAAYQAMTVKSYFNKGKFEQELTGTLIKNLNQTQINNTDGRSRGSSLLPGILGISSARKPLTAVTQAIFGRSEPQELSNFSESVVAPPTSTSAPAGNPTSNGDIVFAGSASLIDETGQVSNFRRNNETGELYDATGLFSTSNANSGQTMAPRDD